MPSEETTQSFINTANSVAAPPLNSYMLKHIQDVMGPDMTSQLVQLFLTYAPQQLVALQQSVATGDTKTLRQQAHQFKGESLQMGADQLSILCEQLEQLAQEGQIEAVLANLAELETELARVTAALAQVGHL